jgi:hypothetical protein
MKKSKTTRKSDDLKVFPPGWDYQRAKSIAEHYHSLKDQSVLDDSAASGRVGSVWMEIPEEMVPQVRKMIARKRKTA